MDRGGRRRGLAYRRAMDKYAQSGWRNPDTGSSGTIQRTSASWVVSDETCANFRETYNPAGEAYHDLSIGAWLARRRTGSER